MIEQDKLIKACARLIFDAIANLIYADPHQWSKRPCTTCRAITALLGEPFGCDRHRKEKQANSKPQENK